MPQDPLIPHVKRAKSSPAQAQNTDNFFETLTYESQTKKSRKTSKAPVVDPTLLAQIIDAQEEGWVNVTKRALKLKTKVME